MRPGEINYFCFHLVQSVSSVVKIMPGLICVYCSSSDHLAPRYYETAAALGVSEAAVRSAIHRLRRRYHAVLCDEVAQTVSEPEALEDELRHLRAIFAAPHAFQFKASTPSGPATAPPVRTRLR